MRFRDLSRDSGISFRVSCFGYQVSGFRFRASGSELRVEGFGREHVPRPRVTVSNGQLFRKQDPPQDMGGCFHCDCSENSVSGIRYLFHDSGIRFRISSFGSRIQDFGGWVSSFGFLAPGATFRISGFWFWGSHSELRGWSCFLFRGSGFAFRVSGLGFWGITWKPARSSSSSSSSSPLILSWCRV